MEKKNTPKGTSRAPIVVILGHVDHGKTTLLDNIRSTNVATKEAGGITQSIGASEVVTKEGKKITFVDTPGHAAFSNMRSRGAKLSDIAVLVVSAIDGVKPQTKEALEYILAAQIPFIVAATKIDLPSSDMQMVQTQLEKEGVLFEGKGGDVPFVDLSGKTGEGVDALLEMITLVSELNEIKSDASANLDATIIETGKDKRGPIATLVVRDGKLAVGDEVVTEKEKFRVRGLFDWTDKPIKEVLPGEAALVIGFKAVPEVGSKIWGADRKEAITKQTKEEKAVSTTKQEGEVSIVLKASSAGSLEAILANLPDNVLVISAVVGDVTESDVFLAKSSDAGIFAFEVKIPSLVKKLARTEDVTIESFNIVYELFEKLEEIIKKGKKEVLGNAEILAEFPFNGKRIAGCRVSKGAIKKTDSLVVMRNESEVGKAAIASIKKGKAEVAEVKQGEECGILFSTQLDFKIGDVILAVTK